MSEIIGHFHPLLVHLPIGFFTLAGVFYLLERRNMKGIGRAAIGVALFLSFLVALISVLTGYLLASDGGYEADLVDPHRMGGFAFAILNGLLWYLYQRSFKEIIIRFLGAFTTVVLLVTGHLGGTITHGEDFLNFGQEKYVKPVIVDPQQALIYKEVIEPIFAEKCWTCHSSKTKKGGLRLDSQEYILAGGKNGKILQAHDVEKSELFHRIILEKSHDDHMPPSGKPQLSKSEIELIQWWIEGGLDFDKKVNEIAQDQKIRSALQSLVKRDIQPVALPKNMVNEADPKVIENLGKSGVSVAKISQNSPFLSLSIYNKNHGKEVLKDMEDIAEQVVWLKAVGIEIDEDWVDTIAKMPNLFNLELRDCTLKSSISGLSQLPQLRVLNLSGSQVNAEDVEALIKIPTLENIYLFRTGIDFKKLNFGFPEKLVVDTGGYVVPMFVEDTVEFKRSELITTGN